MAQDVQCLRTRKRFHPIGSLTPHGDAKVDTETHGEQAQQSRQANRVIDRPYVGYYDADRLCRFRFAEADLSLRLRSRCRRVSVISPVSARGEQGIARCMTISSPVNFALLARRISAKPDVRAADHVSPGVETEYRFIGEFFAHWLAEEEVVDIVFRRRTAFNERRVRSGFDKHAQHAFAVASRFVAERQCGEHRVFATS
ncbi:hypothetical protein G5S35_24905 [Paraburkholderia tropica]|nr:hypothetical protein G5S35_24905 [Paraburkholderia tropica]